MFLTWAKEWMVVTFTGMETRGEAVSVVKDKTCLGSFYFKCMRDTSIKLLQADGSVGLQIREGNLVKLPIGALSKRGCTGTYHHGGASLGVACPLWDLVVEHIHETPFTCFSAVENMHLLSHCSLRCPSTVLMPLVTEYLKHIVDKASLWDQCSGRGSCCSPYTPTSPTPAFPLLGSLWQRTRILLLSNTFILVVNSFRFPRFSLIFNTWLTTFATLIEI